MSPVPTQVTFVTCPACNERNLHGDDQCWNCTESLTEYDLPSYADEATPTELNRTVASLRLRRPHAMPPGASVRDALKSLVNEPGGAIVVVDDRRVVGIFTERDVLNRVADSPGVLDATLASVMTHEPVTLESDDRISVVLNRMGDGGFRHMPVLRDGELIGMVHATDVARWVLLQFFD